MRVVSLGTLRAGSFEFFRVKEGFPLVKKRKLWCFPWAREFFEQEVEAKGLAVGLKARGVPLLG